MLSVAHSWMIMGAGKMRPPAAKRRGSPNDDGRDEKGQLKFIHKARVEESQPTLLLDFVMQAFPIKRTQAKQSLAHNSILVNDQVQVKYNYQLFPGDIVIIRAAGSQSQPTNKVSSLQGVVIIFEDDDIIVVEKPHNLCLTAVPASQASNETSKLNAQPEPSLSAILSAHAARKKQKVFLVHPLDREASGLVVLAKTQISKSFLQKNWASFGRTFLCLCHGLIAPMQGSWRTLQDETKSIVTCRQIGPLSDPVQGIDEEMSKQAKDISNSAHNPAAASLHSAITHYRTLSTNTMQSTMSTLAPTPISLVEVSLETHRRDQIRSQFSFHGNYLVGETLYPTSSPTPHTSAAKVGAIKSNILRPPRLALHASELRIVHPTTGETLTFCSPMPPSISCIVAPSDSVSQIFSDEQEREICAESGSSRAVGGMGGGGGGGGVRVVSLEEWLGSPRAGGKKAVDKRNPNCALEG